MIDIYPYDSELLYSTEARYNYLIGNPTAWDTIEELTDNRRNSIGVLLPRYVDLIAEKLGPCYTPQQLISKHSIYNYYKSFMNLDNQQKLYKSMICESKTSPEVIVGIKLIKSLYKPGLYFCKDCIRRDLSVYGEAYFHIEHQLQGVHVCPHHQLLLQLYPDSLSQELYNGLVRLNPQKVQALKNKAGKNLKVMSQLSEMAYMLILTEQTYYKDQITTRILFYLKENGYLFPNNYVNRSKLIDDLEKYYGSYLFESGAVYKDNIKEWLKKITEYCSETIHPFRYLLLMNFLNIEIGDFFNEIEFDSKIIRKRHSRFENQERNEDAINQCKRDISSYIDFHKNESRSIMARNKEIREQYSYLMNYEKDWMDNVLPPINKNNKRYAEWESKDIELLNIMQDEFNRITKFDCYPMIRSGLFYNKMQKHFYSERSRKMLPKTFEFIFSVIETPEQYYLRKCKYIIDKMLEAHVIPKPYLIREKSGLNNKQYKLILPQIIKYIETRDNALN